MARVIGGIDWGRTPPEKRGRWGRWLYLHRWNAQRQTQDDVRETLAKMGNPIGPSYYSEIENGTTQPNEDWQAVFIRLWGDEPEPEEVAATVGGDLVVQAINAQTVAITAQTEATRQQTEVLGRLLALLEGRVEAPAVGRLGAALVAAARLPDAMIGEQEAGPIDVDPEGVTLRPLP